MSLEIRQLTPADEAAAIALLGDLNPEVPGAVLETRLTAILHDHPHYQLLGAFSGSSLAGLAGIWIATKIWCGRYLEVDNLVVHPDHRSEGIGSFLIREIERIGREKDCNLLVLDSYTSNYPSHRLYYRLGFEIRGFHFVKPLADLNG